MSEREYIDVEYADGAPPQSWNDIPRFLAERNDRTFEVDYEAHERATNPNGLSLRDTLQVFAADADILFERITALYPVYVNQDGLKPDEATRYFRYAAKGLTDPARVTRALDRAALLARGPDIERRFEKASDPERHRAALAEALKHRSSLEPLRLNVDAIDSLLPGGIGMGEVLHIVGGEGGLKTSVLLHVLTDYARRGGKAFFLSLDMSPQTIEIRLLMRLLNCNKEKALEHIAGRSPEYLRALEERREVDDHLRIMGGPMTLPQVETAVLASGADVVGIDYLTCITGFADELTTARAVAHKVRQWRDRWGITFVLLSQMSRASRTDQSKGDTGGHAIGGSSLEQLVDYELELLSDAPLAGDTKPRLIATLRKNRNGPSGRSFQLFPFFPSIEISTKAEPVEHAAQRKPIFQSKIDF